MSQNDDSGKGSLAAHLTRKDLGTDFIFFIFYLFIHELQRERETETETQAEGEVGSTQRARCGT